MEKTTSRRPAWINKKLSLSACRQVRSMLRDLNLHTVCEESLCPNISECFQKPTATFMILGDVCTRNCRFCGVTKGKPSSVDPNEPRHIAEVVRALELNHVVITSVTRDDLDDGGANQFAQTVEQIHDLAPESTIEALIPDFGGIQDNLQIVMNSHLDILNHNVETVPKLYHTVRPEADFERSLTILRRAKAIDPEIITKSGLMVGLGETFQEIQTIFERLADVGCDALTIGQYLSPSKNSAPVVKYIVPDDYLKYQDAARKAGIPWVHAGPFVRSSYNAEALMQRIRESHFE